MKQNQNLKNYKGCVALGEEGKETCCNLVTWKLTPEVPDNPPCRITAEDEEKPEYKALILSQQVILKAVRF